MGWVKFIVGNLTPFIPLPSLSIMTDYSEGAEVAGRFVIIDRIGEGGMGAVYRALQISLDREVALKVLHANVALTARARRRFAREARAIARLNHPHIASVFDFGVDGQEVLWLAMEMIHGEAMTRLKRDQLDLMRILSLTDQILSALSAAHARGIIHRDLKPSNVLLTKDDEGRETIKLVDFGLAASNEGELDLTNAPLELGDEESEGKKVILGTPRYMAPEIFRRAPLDPRVDLYALGIMLFEILSGQPPYPGDDPKEIMRGHIKHPIPQLVARDHINVPTELERCIYTLIAKNPNDRFQTAAEVREVISQIVNEFSYVPWMAMGPQHNAANFHLVGNISQAGFVSSFGGQTVAPASMMLGRSKLGAANHMLAPLVGRASERRAIEQRLRQAMLEGLGSLVLVEGEAGVGKTRLLEWVKVRVEEAGLLHVLQGGHSRASNGFSGMRSILERLFGVDDFSPDDAPFVIAERMKKWGFQPDETDRVVRLLAPSRQDSGNEHTTSSDQEHIFSTLERLLRRAASSRPLLLLLEDLHHASDLTIGLLEHLAIGFHLSPAPIVMICAVRSEEIEQLPRLKDALERLSRFGSKDIVRVHLERLSPEESASLVSKILPVSQELAMELGERAAGNPLHITQVIQYLQESQKIHYESGTWSLAEGVHLTREIPDEIADMMRYRATQHIQSSSRPDATRAILDRAALLGQQFAYALLRAMLSYEPLSPWLEELDHTIDELISQGLLREAGYSGHEVLEFQHAMMRDVLLQDFNARRAERELHKTAADAKVAYWGTHVGAHSLDIAQHYEHAKYTEGVYKYTLIAAQQAMVDCDLKEAMRLFKRVEMIAESAANASSLDPFAMTSLEENSSFINGQQIALEVAHLARRLGEYDSAKQDYRKLLNVSGDIALWSKWGLGDLAIRQGDYKDAVNWFEAARRDALHALQFPTPDVHDSIARLVDAYCLFGLGYVGAQRNDLEPSQTALQNALESAMACEEKLLETEILRCISDVSWLRGDHVTAEEARQRSSLIVEHYGDHEERALSMLHAAQHAQRSGLHANALARAEQAQELFETLGKRHYAAHCMLTLGHLAQSRGDNKEAAQLFRKAHRFYEMFNDRAGLTLCKHHLADLAIAIRRFPDTQVLIRDALEGYRVMGDRRSETMCWLTIGRLEHELGHLDKAERTFAECAKKLSKIGDIRASIFANLLRALSLAEHGQLTDCEAILNDLLTPLREYPFFDEAYARTLDRLSELLASSCPDIAIDLDTLAEQLWQGMGKSPQSRS